MEVHAITMVTEDNHGENGSPVGHPRSRHQGRGQPDKSLIGPYGFEGKPEHPVTIQVTVPPRDATCHPGADTGAAEPSGCLPA